MVSTRSLVDYVKQMHRAMNADDAAFYAIPDDPDLIAQYFLAYSASASPTDFEEVVDYDFRLANVRASLDQGRSSICTVVVQGAQRYLEETFNTDGIRASLAGWGNLAHHWRIDIARSQWLGLPAALFAVGTVTALCFRSAAAGVLSVIPAFLAVALVYAVMAMRGIWMDFANSVPTTLRSRRTTNIEILIPTDLATPSAHHGLLSVPPYFSSPRFLLIFWRSTADCIRILFIWISSYLLTIYSLRLPIRF